MARMPSLPVETGPREEPSGPPAAYAKQTAIPPAPVAPPVEPKPPLGETRTAVTASAKKEPKPDTPPPAPESVPPPQPSTPAPLEDAASAAEPFTLKGFTVFFTQNSTEIPVYANAVLTSAAALMKSSPTTAAVIEGHTDSVGDPGYNKLVSENRAAAVRNFLVGQGIPLSRLSVAGFGSEKPIEDNGTAEGRSKNRRVVIRLVPGKRG
jgi:OOP family OmpA-OmpF porin